MVETPFGGNLGDAFFWLGTVQGLPHFLIARGPEITHWRAAFEIPEMLQERAPRHTGGRDDLRQSDSRIEVRPHILDGPLDVTRGGRPFKPLQSFAIVMRLMEQQRAGHEFAERPRRYRLQ